VFGKGNDFARRSLQRHGPKGQLQAFRTSATLRVAVTVDMIATGTDVKPLECVFFLRDVGGGVLRADEGPRRRTIAPPTSRPLLPTPPTRTRFVIVDASASRARVRRPPLTGKGCLAQATARQAAR